MIDILYYIVILPSPSHSLSNFKPNTIKHLQTFILQLNKCCAISLCPNYISDIPTMWLK